MNVYYKKIILPLLDFEAMYSGILLHHPNKMDLKYFQITNEEHLFKLKKLLPETIQNSAMRIHYCIMTGPGKLVPHIDKGANAVINIYFKSGNGITTFYECHNPETPALPGQFKNDDVFEVDSFTALDEESYILNVSKIHNIELPTASPRHFINYCFITDNFDTINKSFEN